MLIGQDLHLIEDQLSVIVSPLVITYVLEEQETKVLWQDLVQKQNIMALATYELI